MDTQIAKDTNKGVDNSVGMISNNHIDKDINKNEGKVIQLAHNADKNKVAGNRSTEHPSSDIHKTVDKTVKTKEKASTPSKKQTWSI